MAVTSQPLKWHGGKSYLATWLQSLAPPSVNADPVNGYTHRNIAFAGGLGEFWNWECEGISEAVNDRNSRLHNFYRVLREPKYFEGFRRMVDLSPMCEELWDEQGDAATYDSDPIDDAYRFFIMYRQSRQGLGKDYATPTTRTRRGMNENVSAWLSAVDGLPECHARLRRVEIRNMDAIAFIRKYDHPRALFYCDPPYLHTTRSSTGEYGANEMTETQHFDLLKVLGHLKGRFMLSGYHSAMYDGDAARFGWNCHEKVIDNKASGAKAKRKQVECVWTNY